MSDPMEKIVLLCDSKEKSQYFIKHLQDKYTLEVYFSLEEALCALSDASVAVVIADCEYTEAGGLSLLKQAIQVAPSVIRIGFSNQKSIELAADAVNQGQVFRYLYGQQDPDQLINTIQEGLQVRMLEIGLNDILDNVERDLKQSKEQMKNLVKTIQALRKK